MRHPARLLAALALAAALPVAVAHAEGLALRRVMLSSGGVAYVEYAAEADGAATLGLDVPLDQVDDVLTSLVVFDSAGGIGGIELPGRDGAAAAFGDVPFTPETLDSPLDFLNSLQGVMLEVAGPRPMSGRLLRAERVEEPGPGPRARPAPRTRVTLMAAEGIRQFILEEADSVQVADPALRTRIARAIAALRRDAGHSARHLTLRMAGTGKRDIRVGYVAAAALWKASYRLVLPADPAAAKARLQGWAVLENTSGVDWNGIELALQYGNPVSFHQAIYRSYFVKRPEVPVEILGRLLPDVDTRATAMREAPPPPPPAPAMAPAPAGRAMTADRLAVPMAPIAAPADAATGTEGAVDTVFTLPHPVVLAAGHTASLPILDREVTARRVGLVQQGRPHPLAAVELVNDTTTSLPAGVLTLYDAGATAAFAGDARLGGLPAGESRLLAFAEDLRTTSTWRVEQATTIASLTAAGGVVRLQQRQRWTAHIDLAAPAGEARALLVEIPRRGGTLVPPAGLAGPITETATAWRLPVALAAGEQRSLTVHVDHIVQQQMALAGDDGVVVRLLGMQGLEEPARAALRHLADLRGAEAARIAERDRLAVQREEAERNEDRIRKNLAAVPANDAMHGRLLRQLDAEETRIATLAESIARADAAVDAARQALAKAVAELKI